MKNQEQRIGKIIAIARALHTSEIDALRKRKGKLTEEVDQDLHYARCVSDLFSNGALTIRYAKEHERIVGPWGAIAGRLGASLRSYNNNDGEALPFELVVTMPDRKSYSFALYHAG
jgi:hypothetical protein